MVGKKGFLRVVEAMIAVMIILGALLVITPNKENVKRDNLTAILRSLLDELAKNQELRQKIVNYNLSLCEPPNQLNCRERSPNKEILLDLDVFFEERIKNPSFNFSVSVCKTDRNSPCTLSSYPSFDTDVYSAERIITSTVTQEDPSSVRKVKIFLWRRL